MAKTVENVLKLYIVKGVRIAVGKLKAQKYILDEDAGIELPLELNVSIDREYFNLELEDGTVYSIET